MTSAPAQSNAPHDYVADCKARAAHWAAAGRPDYAAHFYGAVLDVQPEDTRTRMMLADCLVRARQTITAAEHYLRVAQDYGQKRRDRETMAISYQVLHLDPRRFVYMAVAPMLRKVGRLAYPLCTRGADAHLAEGRVSDALDLLRLGTEINPLDPEAHCQYAQLLLSQHLVRDAVAHLAQAGRLLLNAGNNAKYVEVAEQVLRFDAQHLETLRELPRVYLRIGEPQRAVVKLSDLMRVSPGDTVGFEILAHAFATIGRTPTALSILGRLADELTSTGRRAEADAILERARGWRLRDASFADALAKLRKPRIPAPPPPRRSAPRPTTSDGTVVLKLSDLMEAEAPPPPQDEIIDLSELVEIADGEDTVMLRLQDFTKVGPVPVPPPGSAPRSSSRAVARHEAVSTSVIDLEFSDLELDDLERTDEFEMHTMGYGELTALVHDEESMELPTSSRPGPGLPRRTMGLAERSVPRA